MISGYQYGTAGSLSNTAQRSDINHLLNAHCTRVWL